MTVFLKCLKSYLSTFYNCHKRRPFRADQMLSHRICRFRPLLRQTRIDDF